MHGLGLAAIVPLHLYSINNVWIVRSVPIWSDCEAHNYVLRVTYICLSFQFQYRAKKINSIVVLCFIPTSIHFPLHSLSSVVMHQCWREDPEERPTFSQLSSIVEKLLTSVAGYTQLGMVLLDTSQEEEQLSKLVYMYRPNL